MQNLEIGGLGEEDGMQRAREGRRTDYADSMGDLPTEAELMAKGRSKWPWFWQPYNVNENVARLIGLQAVIISVVAIIFRKHDSAWYTVLGMGFDYVLRFVGGGKASLMGTIAQWIASAFYPRIPIHWTPGPPKQFAAVCGGFMCFAAAVIYFYVFDDKDDASLWASVVIVGLIGAAGMESFLNFCLGCWMFSMATRVGLIDPVVYSHTEMVVSEQRWASDIYYRRLGEDQDPPVVEMKDTPDSVPFLHKRKTREMMREQVHFVKGMRLHYFAMPLGFLGTASVWKMSHLYLDTPSSLYKGLGIFGALLTGLLVVITVVQAFAYPRKTWKQMTHPVESNFMVVPFICILMFVFLLDDDEDVGDNDTLRRICYWAGAPMSFLLGVLQVANWIVKPQHSQTMSPAWLFPPLASIVAAMVSRIPYGNESIRGDFAELGLFYFSFGTLMWIVLTPMVLYRMSFQPLYVDEMRSSVPVLFASPATIAFAYKMLVQEVDVFFRFALFTSYAMVILCVILTYKGYLMSGKWEMSYWGYVFPFAALTFPTFEYHQEMNSAVSLDLVYICMALTSFVLAATAAHTVLALVERRAFNRADKWGPVSFIKVQHFAFEEFTQELVDLAQLAMDKPAGRIKILQKMVGDLKHAHLWHSRQEDDVVFTHFNEQFANVSHNQGDEHVHERADLEKVEGLLASLEHVGGRGTEKKERKKAILREVVDLLVPLQRHLTEHMATEEADLVPIGRKYFNLDIQIEIMRGVYFHTPPTEWARLIPFYLEALPTTKQRVRLTRCFIWALPERAQLFGKWAKEGLPGLMYDMIARECPEIIPRHAQGWEYHA